MSKDRGLRLGVDLGGSKIAGIVLDAQERVCAERRVVTPKDDYASTVATVVELIGALETDLDEADLPVGIGAPGSLDADGRVVNANSQCLNGRALGADIEQALGRTVRLANDADCLALSEAYDGVAANTRSSFAVILGTGVGGGFVFDGQLLTGRNGLAGEWGHIALPWTTANEARQAPRCWCGLEGCIEAWLSGPGMSADHLRRGGQNLAAQQIVARAESGERLAGATLKAWLQRLARSLAMVINLVDPEVIVIGGGLSQIRWIYSEVPKVWVAHIFCDRVTTAVCAAAHGDASGVRGAARLWALTD